MLRILLISLIVIVVSCKPKDIASSCFEVTQGSDIVYLDPSCSMQAERYFWTFGDGLSSSEENPQHVYASGGTYVIRLEVTGKDGSVSYSENTVNVEVNCHECDCDIEDPINPGIFRTIQISECGTHSQIQDFYIRAKDSCAELGGYNRRCRKFKPQS
jgi:hypothetical protein